MKIRWQAVADNGATYDVELNPDWLGKIGAVLTPTCERCGAHRGKLTSQETGQSVCMSCRHREKATLPAIGGLHFVGGRTEAAAPRGAPTFEVVLEHETGAWVEIKIHGHIGRDLYDACWHSPRGPHCLELRREDDPPPKPPRTSA
jgi:hypothetical protein